MNSSLSTFMKIAITAIVIGSLIFGSMYALVDSISDDVGAYID